MDATDRAILAIRKDDASLPVVEVATSDYSHDCLQRFADCVAAMPEVMEVYRMAGDVDYLLRIAVPDMARYDGFYRRLVAAFPLKNVTSRFAMERVKFTTAYPVPKGDLRRRVDEQTVTIND